MGEKKLLNKVFFVHKKYSRSFITLRLNHWCHMDYFNNVLTTFLGLDVSVTLLSMQGQKALGFHQIYLNSCSDDERMSYGFGTTWGWVINDRIFILGELSLKGEIHFAVILCLFMSFPMLLGREGWFILQDASPTLQGNVNWHYAKLRVAFECGSCWKIHPSWHPDVIVYMQFSLINNICKLYPAVRCVTSCLFAAYTCQPDKTSLFFPAPQNASERAHPVYEKCSSRSESRGSMQKREVGQ